MSLYYYRIERSVSKINHVINVYIQFSYAFISTSLSQEANSSSYRNENPAT